MGSSIAYSRERAYSCCQQHPTPDAQVIHTASEDVGKVLLIISELGRREFCRGAKARPVQRENAPFASIMLQHWEIVLPDETYLWQDDERRASIKRTRRIIHSGC